MSVFRLGMALVGVALMAAGVSVWLNDSTPHSVPESGGGLPLSPNTVGRSAISHGGPPREGTVSTAGASTAPFVVGQHVILQQPLIVSPSPQSAQPAMMRTLSPGTEMIVSTVVSLRPEQKEQYYEIMSSDGLTVRAPERALRARDAGRDVGMDKP